MVYRWQTEMVGPTSCCAAKCICCFPWSDCCINKNLFTHYWTGASFLSHPSHSPCADHHKFMLNMCLFLQSKKHANKVRRYFSVQSEKEPTLKKLKTSVSDTVSKHCSVLIKKTHLHILNIRSIYTDYKLKSRFPRKESITETLPNRFHPHMKPSTL